MKRFTLATVCAFAGFAAPAFAADPNAKIIGCFEEVLVPATYTVKKVKLKDAYQQYERQANGLVYLLEYPAVFREDRTLHTEEHIVMRPVTCE